MVVEGGVLPWQIDKTIIKPYFNQDVVYEPLPPPPQGWAWKKDDKGNYELVQSSYKKADESDNEVKEDGDFIEHVVLPSDTLAGICLRYKIKKYDLRRHNFFVGENIRSVEILKIPLNKGKTIKKQKESRQVKLQKIKNATKGLGAIEAEFYLDEADGDVVKAIAKARSDDAFEEKAKFHRYLQAAEIEDKICIHLDKATNLKDTGLTTCMHIYVIASLWLEDTFLGKAKSAVTIKTDAWRWSAAQPGSTIELPLRAGVFSDLCLFIQVKAQNDLLDDDHVASSKKIPISRLVDGAIHAIALDSGGDIFLSIHAPASLPRDAVRAVAIAHIDEDSDNPFIPPVLAVAASVPSFSYDASEERLSLSQSSPQQQQQQRMVVTATAYHAPPL
uniref:LysM domain-containing protein n=1 Tax=Aureoumbra lagunensis TaxID=44058 RepID=A0A6S8A5I8_9STRA|mmetsp:Transcript_4072/g.5717  ORF Transcript_4072/g.5717 Transcript_4072/m.5717 type:complete len:389 (+) Transcript_4072:93-1259(+)